MTYFFKKFAIDNNKLHSICINQKFYTSTFRGFCTRLTQPNPTSKSVFLNVYLLYPNIMFKIPGLSVSSFCGLHTIQNLYHCGMIFVQFLRILQFQICKLTLSNTIGFRESDKENCILKFLYSEEITRLTCLNIIKVC